jgi:hypothetical protein
MNDEIVSYGETVDQKIIHDQKNPKKPQNSIKNNSKTIK